MGTWRMGYGINLINDHLFIKSKLKTKFCSSHATSCWRHFLPRIVAAEQLVTTIPIASPCNQKPHREHQVSSECLETVERAEREKNKREEDWPLIEQISTFRHPFVSPRQSKSKEKTCFRSDSTCSSTSSGAWIHAPEVMVSCGIHAATYSSDLLVSIAIYLDMLNTKKCRFITLKYFFGQIAIML
jgi:hypothetical protein